MSTDAVALLRDPATIRARCEQVFRAAQAGKTQHFRLHEEKLASAATRVAEVTRAAYPTLAIPYHARWRHFDVGGVERAKKLDAKLSGKDAAEQARVRIELAVTSVLLDAGAGDAWRFNESGGGTYARSEGLAVASFHMFLAGAFSSQADAPLRADAEGLKKVTPATIARGFQVGEGNPLVGLEGRADLLRRLGDAVAQAPAFFGKSAPRLGGLYDVLAAQAKGGELPAAKVLAAVLEGLGPVWPARTVVDGVNVGDVGRHPLVEGPGATNHLVPFHKLSQWLTYSLLEPLEWAGLKVTGLDALTGLPEYRNGGLFVDSGVLEPMPHVLEGKHPPDSEPIVEWRALTVSLLDRVAVGVREKLGLSAAQFPLAKVLEGGTWATGRVLAKEKRPGGGPPIQIQSDGTVF